MSTEPGHLAMAGLFIKSNWHWLSASVAGLAYGATWAVKAKLRQMKLPAHPTFEDINVMRKSLLSSLASHERDEFARFDSVAQEQRDALEAHRREHMDAISNVAHHVEKIDDKVTGLTRIIIENMRARN